MSEPNDSGNVPRDVIARIAVGFAEAEASAGAREVDGNNSGPWVEKYLNANHPGRISHRGEPWCVAFFLWCWQQALTMSRRELPFPFTRSCGQLWEHLQTHGSVYRFTVGEGKPPFELAPGDAVFWDFNQSGSPDHVNMVHRIEPDGVLYTIGGNEGSVDTGAPVKSKRRGSLAELRGVFGFGRLLCEGSP